MAGIVKSINISEKKGTIKTPILEGQFIEEHGLENDAHAGNSGHRQVSLLAQESINILLEKGGMDIIDVGKFAENITTEGIELYTLPVGTKFKIGESIQEVTQIGKECHSGCEISRVVGTCIMPTQGIFTKVLVSGHVKVGDTIEVINE